MATLFPQLVTDVAAVETKHRLIATHAETPRHAEAKAGERGLSFVEAQKPIRIVRHGGSYGKGGREGEKHVTHDKCGSTHKVVSSSDKWTTCPEACPFYAQNRNDDDFCTFACVEEPQCAQMNPHTPIGDKRLGVCRSCVVEGCAECDTTVTVDRCAKCQWAYYLKSDGKCYFRFYHDALLYLGYALAAIVVAVLIWLIDMGVRPIYNQAGFDHALELREAAKLRQDKNESGKRELWPLTTNLFKKQVAGPGMMLHFNFQVALIGWAVFVAIVWMCLATFIDEALWVLGTRAFGTPRMNCILVAWGYETQQRLMWTKVLFLWIVYLGSFAGCIVYGIFQLRSFQATDYAHKTMKDYVLMITGLPSMEYSRRVEDELKDAIERATDLEEKQVIGVSVAWDYGEQETEIDDYAKHVLDLSLGEEVENPHDVKDDMNAVRKALIGVEASIFGADGDQKEETEAKDDTDVEEEVVPADPQSKMDEVLQNLKTSQRAFVVFDTEESRDKAAAKGSFEFGGESNITMEPILAEPGTVQWQNFGRDSFQMQVTKLICGFGAIALACGVWALVFYAPYAYYVMTFNYENGREPGFIVGFAFSMIVCIGNVIMYDVCGRISDWVGFRFRDQREACYMILYTIACMFNVMLDFVTTYFTAEKVMEGLGFRTYFGVPLQDVPTFTAKFETYGMQRSLAENTYSYAFPSSYLIPFLIEPIATITIPLYLGRWIVKSHKGMSKEDAEDWLAMAPMDMGRYADLLLNAILGILIFYFPGGYTWQLFLFMALSHVYIYLFDHIKVLRYIPTCTYASFEIEWCGQAMFAPIIGVMASCLAFKANCERGYHCTTGIPLIATCCMAWLVHVIIHMTVLCLVVPRFGLPPPEEDPEKDKTYQQVAEATPSTWFSTNKVHCLRSKLKYGHLPPCSYMRVGHEKFMKANKDIGCFYEEKADCEG